MKYLPINADLFVHNRRRFAQRMKPDSIAIFYSNDRVVRSGDTYYPFRQDSGLFYLSGLDQPQTVVVLFPGCVKEGFHELAFVQRPDGRTSIWQGALLSPAEVRYRSGIERVYYLDELERILHELILLANRIYLNLPEHPTPPLPNSDAAAWHRAYPLQRRYPAHKYHRAAPILKQLMMIKSPPEIELLQRAIQITGGALRAALAVVQPGAMEYEVEAAITGAMLRQRATGHAFPPIVASGPNSCVLHYEYNNRRCQAGELLLLDFGAEYANYAADISRTVPVSGQFSERQRAVYAAVLRIQRAAQALLLPGSTLEEYHREVGKLVEENLCQLGVLTPADLRRQPADQPAYKRYFMHGTSHHLGLDVHDQSNRYEPLQAGMVLTCEPAIYLPDEDIGIRLEDDILITDDGPVNLSAAIPIEAEAIEELMQQAMIG